MNISDPADYLQQAIELQAKCAFAEALASCERAINLEPSFAQAHNNRGVALASLGRHQEALLAYRRALDIKPDLAPAHDNTGIALQELGLHRFAILNHERALAIEPASADAHANLANALRALGERQRAIEHYDRALALDPTLAGVHGIRLLCKREICDWRGASEERDELARRLAQGHPAAPPFAVLCLLDSLALQQWAAAAFSQRVPSPLPHCPSHPRHHRLRVGYSCADFREHPLMRLMVQLFEHHDKSRIELVGFAFGPRAADAMARRVGACFDRFIDVRGLGDMEVVQLARTLEIDLAVDLSGLTENNRTTIFALRAAPIQVSFQCYAATMGTPYMDYLLADPVVIPEGSRHGYTEQVVYLPHCYQLGDRERPVAVTAPSRAAVGLPAKGFVYCCFNNNYKITPEIFDVWMRILRAVPHSVLWLLEDSKAAADNLRREAAAREVEPDRLVFAPRVPLAEHLARHAAADLFLDTLPYNAHTTANDALWMGVPVLTCPGESFAARVGASLLTEFGITELIAPILSEYENRAVDLGRSPLAVRALAARVRAGRGQVSVFDPSRFARSVEAAYLQMQARWESGLPPEPFRVCHEGQRN